MSLQMLAAMYGGSVGNSSGPVPESWSVSTAGPGRVSVTVDFEPVFDAGHLHLHGTACCDNNTFFPDGASAPDHNCCAESPFEVGTADGTWWRTEVPVVMVAGDRVSMQAVVGRHSGPVHSLRYAFSNFPTCVLYSGRGGPADRHGIAAAPFRLGVPGGCPANTTTCESVALAPSHSVTQCCTPAPNAEALNGEHCVRGAGCLQCYPEPCGG